MAPNFIETFEGIFKELEKEFMKTKEPETKVKIAYCMLDLYKTVVLRR